MAKQRTKQRPKGPSGARPAPRPPGARRRPKRRTWGTRRRRWTWWLLVVIAVVAIGIGLLVASRGSKSSSSGPTSSSAQVLAPAGQPTGQPIDAVECNVGEQLAFHIHAHLALFVDGAERAVPAFVGFYDNQCLYWLHSHDSSGIIHMEAPRNTSFTLGQWFDIWGQPLSSTQVGPAGGTVTSYVNGQRFSGDPRTIPLTAHAVIQLNVGNDVAPKSYQFPEGY
jgi:hypothetical protein